MFFNDRQHNFDSMALIESYQQDLVYVQIFTFKIE